MGDNWKTRIYRYLDGWPPFYLAGVYCILVPIWMKLSYTVTTELNYLIGLWVLIGIGLLFRLKVALVIAVVGFPLGYCYDYIIGLLNLDSSFGSLAFYFRPPSYLLLSYIAGLFTWEHYVHTAAEQRFLMFIYYYIHILILIPHSFAGVSRSRYRLILYLLILALLMPLCGFYESQFSYNELVRGREMSFAHGMTTGTLVMLLLIVLKRLEAWVWIRLGLGELDNSRV
jgi:hypothetical protein